ncbi:MAG: (deoxy)nucleoside triphosphate pyrophosphohydrolase [Myxococcota bacterium]|jgi:8-oxo-dGTP diphosphatase|nr:(deoxy)nucleoside triphosphate pyrophosphohydrolase [Myxococcota bacterium]
MPETVQVVAGAMLRSGRVFAAQRCSGKWEFPGGKVEPGESPQAALRRELREELSVEVQVLSFLGVCEQALEGSSDASPKRLRLELYQVSLEDGEPQLTEHQAGGWFGRAELEALDLGGPDRALLVSLYAALSDELE